ncbi:unnamed protein product [Bursaphelenchus okinawaensis]|uniref:Uncharacterized protein n=1 Tax=Bursaphelenchus okinawaensis TaxID=465554 RepID=A0A811KKH7_9BILA|nr:unnamed protein product [Bursaphelenchus okinawaensis]CAG9104389.1 unnamed protein product [Bursaphelenchus okinawaensis]
MGLQRSNSVVSPNTAVPIPTLLRSRSVNNVANVNTSYSNYLWTRSPTISNNYLLNSHALFDDYWYSKYRYYTPYTTSFYNNYFYPYYHGSYRYEISYPIYRRVFNTRHYPFYRPLYYRPNRAYDLLYY